MSDLERRLSEMEYQVAAYHTSCTGLAILVVIQTALMLWTLFKISGC